MKRILILLLIFSGVSLKAQYVNPNVKWELTSKEVGDHEFELKLTANISKGFHLYSEYIGEGGPIPTSFTFDKSTTYKLEGKVKESGNRHEAIEPLFDNMKLIWFEEKGVFTQRIKLLKDVVTVKGVVTFMTCNDQMCDPPSDHAFELKLKGSVTSGNASDMLKKSSVMASDPTVNEGYVNRNVAWSASTKKISNDQFSIVIKAIIAPGYHLYSQFNSDSAPVATSFTFSKSSDYKLIGSVKESGNRHEEIEPLFDNMRLIWYQDNATFTQQVKILKDEVTIRDTVSFMTCNDKMCDLRSSHVFEIKLNANDASLSANDSASDSSAPVQDSSAVSSGNMNSGFNNGGNSNVPPSASSSSSIPISSRAISTDDVRNQSYWEVFMAGFLTGLLALLFPCVWPVIPLTVSYFLKHSSNKRKGRMNAVIYALSITAIFVVLGVFVSLVTNGQKLNELSTGWFFNMLFFVLFFLFGLSFLGVFEITLPAGLINRSESLSEKGGLLGIFFMAFTLVLVSFSCTLPFIANLISVVTQDNEFIKPLIGFTAFGLALGLPFGLFAWFPSGLKKLPKSGGWMHSLKVTFGFIEIALSFIYLSKVDMAYHWGFLSRDIFLAIWIILFGVLGFYLLGKIHLSPDDDVSHVSVPRLLFGIVCLSFAVYMTPGLWGSPLTSLSGFLPNHIEFDVNKSTPKEEIVSAPKDSTINDSIRWGGEFETPLGLRLYFDFDDALAHAKAKKKPLFVDFTGWGCVNCRKMEKTIWPNPEVLKRLKEDYVTASLYVDDKKIRLPQSEQYFSKALNKEVVTLGDKNFDIQYSRFSMGAQPYYVLLDDQGHLLTEPRGYTPDPLIYVQFLDQGLEEFKKRRLASLK